MDLQTFCDEINRIFREKYAGEGDYATAPADWQESFDEGLTPEQALLLDFSYGD